MRQIRMANLVSSYLPLGLSAFLHFYLVFMDQLEAVHISLDYVKPENPTLLGIRIVQCTVEYVL